MITRIRSFFLGSVEKIGIVPGLIATVLAMGKVNESTGFSLFEYASFAIFGLYIVMLPLMTISLKSEQYASMLEFYIAKREFREEES